ncbi:cystatin domain protein [Medicago truncatula]|nr:cystatin domain protein [Medicago truncatula]
MEHHPSSSSSSSSSAAPTTPSEIVSRFRLRVLSLRARRSPPPDVCQKMQHPPSSSAALKSRRRTRRRSRVLQPSDFNDIKDPTKKDRITKCATLAIRDYNSQTQNDYQLVVVDTFTSQFVNGFLYCITFQASNADKEYATFEAIVFGYGKREFDLRKVIRIRIKGTSTW